MLISIFSLYGGSFEDFVNIIKLSIKILDKRIIMDLNNKKHIVICIYITIYINNRYVIIKY